MQTTTDLRVDVRGSEMENPTLAKCPVAHFLDLVGGKWKILILFHVSRGTNRFGALQRAIPQISKQMLTTQLRELEADGVIHREVFAVVPPRVDYSLTPLGQSLIPLLQQISAWGMPLVQAKAR